MWLMMVFRLSNIVNGNICDRDGANGRSLAGSGPTDGARISVQNRILEGGARNKTSAT
jgi:hypothetical protein